MLIENADVYGGFYDDYYDYYFGDSLFETLAKILLSKKLDEKDFERLAKIAEKDDYAMMDPFFFALSEDPRLVNFVGYLSKIRKYVGDLSYAQVLMKAGRREEAIQIVLGSKELNNLEKLNFLLKVDEKLARDFANKASIGIKIVYYINIGEYEKAIELYMNTRIEEIFRKEKELTIDIMKQIFKAIKEHKNIRKEAINKFAEEAYRLQLYKEAVHASQLAERYDIITRIIESSFASLEFKLKCAKILAKVGYREGEKAIKKFIENVINMKKSDKYYLAAEAILALRDMMDEDAWKNYVGKIIDIHYRKKRFMEELRKRGIQM